MPSYLETELHMNFKSLTSYMVGSYTAMILGKILAGYLLINLIAVLCLSLEHCQRHFSACDYFL
jgi:hypothetical protein